MTLYPRTPLLTLPPLILAAGLAILTGCSSKSSGDKKPVTVNCDQLCDKTFGTCMDEVLLNSGKMDSKKMATLKKLGFYKKVQKEGHDKCLSACRKQKGRFRNAKAANKCLAIQDCKKFAPCINKHIK